MPSHKRSRTTHLIIHCAATPEGRDVTAAEIDRWHRARGFFKIGYHYVIRLDGSVEIGRAEDDIGAHCRDGGMNSRSIGICYVGGVDADDVRKAEDTRTPAQKATLLRLIETLTAKYGIPMGNVIGHRDVPGVRKACPSFDVQSWLREAAQA